MDKETGKAQGEKYAIKRDKVAEEVQTVRYTLKEFLELTRNIFGADSCYLYLVNTEMDEYEKDECIRKRVEHIKNVYEKRNAPYPNELENVKNDRNRAKILNFINIAEKDNQKFWKYDFYNKPEKYVVFDKCNNEGVIGDGLKATIELDKIYFDALDLETPVEPPEREIKISIFEEGLNGYIARTKKIVVFSSDKAISRHNSSANYNVKKGITHRCEMMIGFPLIDENKSVIGVLKVEKYIINYDMGEENYKFDKFKIDQGIEDVKKYLPLLVRFIKSSKEDFDTNSYEKLFRGIELLEDLKRIEPIILKDVLIRFLKSLDDFFRTNSCDKLCTTMELLGSLEKIDMKMLIKIGVVNPGLSEKLQDIKWDYAENLSGAKNSEERCQEFKKLLDKLESLDKEKSARLSDCKEELSKLYSNICPLENSNGSQCFEEIDAKTHDLLYEMKQIEKCKGVIKEIIDLLKRSRVNYSEKDYKELWNFMKEFNKEDKDNLIRIIYQIVPEFLFNPKRTKCPRGIYKEICRLLEYLKRIEKYESVMKNINSYTPKNNKLEEELNRDESNHLGKIKNDLKDIREMVEYPKKIYEKLGILENVDIFNEKIKELVESEKNKQELFNYCKTNDYSLLKESEEKLGITQEKAKISAKYYKDAIESIENSLEKLNKKVTYLKETECRLINAQVKGKDSIIKEDFDLITMLLTEFLNELEKHEVTRKVVCDLVNNLLKKEQNNEPKMEIDDYFFKNIDKLEKLVKEDDKDENLLKRIEGVQPQKAEYNEKRYEFIFIFSKILHDEITKIEEINRVLTIFKGEAKLSSEVGYEFICILPEILHNKITKIEEINRVLTIIEGEAKLSSEVYEEVDKLLDDLKILEILEKIKLSDNQKISDNQKVSDDQKVLDNQEEGYCDEACKIDINNIKDINELKEILKTKYEYSNKIKTTLKENNEIGSYSNKIIDNIDQNTSEIYDDFDEIRKLVQKQKNFQHRLLKNSIKIKYYERFCEEISHLLEDQERYEKIKVKITKIKDNVEDCTDSSKYNNEIYNLLGELSHSEIVNLLKYLRTIKPVILENIKGIKDEVKIIRDICDDNFSENIRRPICPEQVNKEIYDITLDLFFELKRKEYIGYDEILNGISIYMNHISQLLNLNADMIRSYKEILDGVRKHEELLLCGVDDYRDHFVHQFHVFISGYIIINELGIDSFVDKIKKNRKHILDEKKDSYELSKSDILRIWFLAASYHDYAYILEKIEKELKSFFTDILGYSFDIEFDWKSLLTTKTEFPKYLNQFIELFDSEKEGKQDTKHRQDILQNNYLDAIITEHDHGVLSALLLTKHTEGLKEKRYYEYMCAALAISLHNAPVFEDFTDTNKVLFESFPIAFLLAYCDTAQAFGRLEGKEHVEPSKFPVKFSGIRVEKDQNKPMKKPRITYKLEYLCEQLNKNPTKDKIKDWAKNVNNVFQSEDCHFEIEYYKKGGKNTIDTLKFYH